MCGTARAPELTQSWPEMGGAGSEGEALLLIPERLVDVR